MKPWLLDHLRCPACRSDALLDLTAAVETAGEVVSGRLACRQCGADFEVRDGIPRFVAPEDDYSENFGAQWHRFRTVQIDRLAGHRLSERRFFADTRWPRDWLAGKAILAAGCGAGRFADVIAEHGARVVACDLSAAVDACRANMADSRGASPARGEVAVVQGDLLALPFRPGTFDAVHCAGVIQHTPDPAAVMRALPDLVRPGGRIFYNFYEIDPTTRFQAIKYALRRVTPRWPHARLVRFAWLLCSLLFLPSWAMSRVPVARYFNRFLPICSVHPPGVPLRRQFEMTLLDTVDWYGPRYEIRQDHARVAALMGEIGLVEVESALGLAWGVKPPDTV